MTGIRALGLGLALAAVPAAAAQDVEALASARGIALPQGYYDRVRRDPGFFEFKHAWTHRAAGGPAQVLPPVGEMRMAVIMTLFADSPEPPFPTSTTQLQLFGANPRGNLTQFYREVSGGRVSVTGDVLPWVRSSVARGTAVGTSMGLGGDARMGDYLLDALQRVDATTDLGRYDNDGGDRVPNSGDDDGYVDIAVFQFSEESAPCGGTGPWPHRSTLRGWTGTAFQTNDLRPNGQPVLVDDYLIQSAVDCTGQPQSIAVIAHETGHAFGLPDYYHAVGGILPAQRRWVMGCWALMAAGSWGCGDASSYGNVLYPSHMGSYEKERLGWITELLAAASAHSAFTLAPVQTSGTAVRIPLRGDEEYLLVEYRPRRGFDVELAAGGVLIYHVEPERPLYPCPTCPRTYRVSLVEADGNGALLRTATEGGNRGEAGDVFVDARLNDADFPGLRLNSGAASNLGLSIAVVGDEARIGVYRRAAIPAANVLGSYLGTPDLTATDKLAADAFGNRNGRFDLGDARALLLQGQ